MARNDDQQRESGTPPRVYKSSGVHRRRVDRKGRVKNETEAPAVGQSEGEGKPAVVISPDFGKRTEAQRQADDRWFAAMRENDLVEEPFQGATAQPSTTDGQEAVQDHEPAATVANDRQETQAKPKKEPPAVSARDAQEASRKLPKRAPAEPIRRDDQETAEEVPSKPEPTPATGRLLSRLLKKRSHRIAAVVATIVLIAAIVIACLFAWNRWYRFNDHADLQGTWYAVGTAVPIQIDDASIKLTDDVAYQYEIDAHDKTIRYTFGPMQGQGRYWLSDDRQCLVITDGREFDGTSTALDDLLHSLSDMGDKATGSGLSLPEGDGIIAFTREPYRGALVVRVTETFAGKKAEEEARKEAEHKEADEAAEEEYYYYEEDYEEEAHAEEPSSDEESEQQPADESQHDGESSEEPAGEE